MFFNLKLRKILLISLVVFFLFNCFNFFVFVNADELTENIDEQLNNLDLSELEEFLKLNFNTKDDFMESIKLFLNGEYNFNLNNFLDVLLSFIKSNFSKFLPFFCSATVLLLLYSFVKKTSLSSINNDSIMNLVFIITLSFIITVPVIEILDSIKSIINKIAGINQVLSPIFTTLLISSGGYKTASFFSPVSYYFTNCVVFIFSNVIFPIIYVIFVFGIFSSISSEINLAKFSDFFSSVVKWIIGIIGVVFGIFISVQGLSNVSFDSVSYKATKYILSNSIPLIGGLIKDNLDIIIFGSVLIKNSIGLAVLLFFVLTFVDLLLKIIIFNLLLKLLSALSELVVDVKFNNFFTSISKSITLANVCYITVCFMFFLNIIFVILSTNSII